MRGLRWLFASFDLLVLCSAFVVSCSYFSMVVCCWSCSGCIEDHDQEMMMRSLHGGDDRSGVVRTRAVKKTKEENLPLLLAAAPIGAE